VAAVLGTTFTGHSDDIPGINELRVRLRDERGLDIPLHVDGASGGFVWPFLYPDSEWDFRLEQVRSINVSGHKFGLVYPGIGWLVFREKSDLAEDLVFYENYLGKTDATFTLNFSTGAAMVLAQYYAFVRYGHDGYRYIVEAMQANARALAADRGHRRVPPDRRPGRRAAPAGRVPARGRPQLRRVRRRLPARGGARLDGARLHAAAERAARHDHARAREADARPHAAEHARGRHRRGVRDAEEERRPARPRPQAGEDRHRVLSHPAVA
jgi:glutamate/tyrosine decarboxylase-like PLP-dependent enzyme